MHPSLQVLLNLVHHPIVALVRPPHPPQLGALVVAVRQSRGQHPGVLGGPADRREVV
jgi:hypothetical protein